MNADFEWPSDDEIDAFFANRSPLSALPDAGDALRELMQAAGTERAEGFSEQLDGNSVVLLVGRPRDFETFAAGMVEQLEDQGTTVAVGCLWLSSSELPGGGAGNPGSQVMGSYVDDAFEDATHACVVTTVLDDWGTATAMLLWTAHKAPNAKLSLVGHRADECELDDALAEVSLACGEGVVTPDFGFVDPSYDFERSNEFADVSCVDDQAHVPPFLAHRMEFQAQRRRDPTPPPPASSTPSPPAPVRPGGQS